MSQIEPNVINPRLPDAFLASVLSGSDDIAALIGNRFAPATEGFEPSELVAEGTPEQDAWPFLLFGDDPNRRERLDQYAQTPTLLESPFLLRAFMREDIARSKNQHFEDAPARVQMALQKLFSSVAMQEVLDDDDNVLGIVSGVEILGLHRTRYGKRGTRTCEMGIFILIVCN